MAIRTYKVTLDSKNTIAPEPVYLRQGDKTGAVVIDATLMDNGSPVSLSGLTPMFKANTADGQAVIADSNGFNIVNASGGEFTYQVPNALSAIPGKITTAYFSLSDADGSESTFDVAFIIKAAVDMSQAQADDYITIIDGTLNSLHKQIDAMNTDIKTVLNAYNQGDFYNKSETDSKDGSTLSSAKTYTDNSLSGIVALPETFANLAEIKAKYPSGKNGLMVAADTGHKYIWANNVWTDAGVYQSVGIADKTVTTSKLADSSVVPLKTNFFNRTVLVNPTMEAGGIASATGALTALDFVRTNDFISVVESKSYILEDDKNYNYWVMFYNSGAFLGYTYVTNSNFMSFNTPIGCNQIKVTTYNAGANDLTTKLSVLSSLEFESKLLPPDSQPLFWSGSPTELLNFDTVNKVVQVPIGGFTYKNVYKGMTGASIGSPVSIPYTPTGDWALMGLFYDTKTTQTAVTTVLKIVQYTSFSSLTNNWVLIASFSNFGVVNMSGSYSINGAPFGIGTNKRKMSLSVADTTALTVSAAQTSIEKTDFVGANNPAYTSEVGLYTIGYQFLRLRDSTFKNFKGSAGLKIGNTVGTHSTLTGSDLLFLSNKIGFLSDIRGENVAISNSQFNQNEVGARILGGNVQLANCIINNNTNGIEILAGENDSHGIISNCQINHNTGIALLIDGISSGETISGCHFYFGDIIIRNTTGKKAVRFDNCVIGGTITITDCAKVIFNNCYFPSGYGLTSSVITNATVIGTNNEIEEAAMESVFNTH